MACEPRIITKSIVVEGFQQRGIITDTELVNPCPDPQVLPQYNGGYCDFPEEWNWYKNALPFELIRNAPQINTKPSVFSNMGITHIRGPSVGEGQDLPGWYFYLIAYANDPQEAENRGIPYAPNITDGRGVGGGGPITGLSITNAGSRLDNRIDGQTYNIASQSGGNGGQARISLSGGRLSRVDLTQAGQDYEVGDVTSGIKYSPAFSPDPQNPASFQVSSIDTSGTNENLKINWWIVDPRKVGNSYAGPGNFLYPTDGYAIGDEFQLSVTNNNQFLDRDAIIRVTAIDVTNTVGNSVNLDYTVEQGVGLVWELSSLDRSVDMVLEYDRNITDQVLLQSADEVFDIWLLFAGRKPTDLEFEYFTKQIYNNGGQRSPEIDQQIIGTLGEELDYNLLEIIPECDRLEAEDDLINDIPDGGECVWDRNDFYQGAGTSAGRNVQLKDLWDFLGQPEGPSGPGEGSDIGELVCPKPESGQIDDREPDMSDFAGMRLWRWSDCGQGDLGQYREIIVPCPGPNEGCVNPTVEDNLAIYDEGSKVTWNNGQSLQGNFVKTPKGAVSEAITRQYQTLYGRVPEQAGLLYWTDVTNQVVVTAYAEYWANGVVRWNNGTSTTVPLVKQPLTSNAIAINNLYLSLLGRPAEQHGMEYWASEADSIGITATLQNIESAAVTELQRGGVREYVVGVNRTLELIQDAGTPELARGGVASFKLFCESQVSSDVNLEFFINTRLPPRYGTITSGRPSIEATRLSDTSYLRYNPESQTELVGTFESPNNNNQSKFALSQRFNITWPELEGELFGDEQPPRVERAVVATLQYAYAGTTGIDTGLQFVEYTDNILAGITGFNQITNVNCLDNGYGGALNSNDSLNADLTLLEPNFGFCELINNSNKIDKETANTLAYNESPFGSNRFFWKIQAFNYVLDPETNEPIPGLTKNDVFVSNTDSATMRYFSAYSTTTNPECPEGFKTCPNGEVVCVTQNCPGGPGDNCNNLSISCGGDNNLNVETNEPTTIRFSYRVNGANNCSTKGSAKVSIRRYWPCPVFGPPSGAENQWVVQKQPVSINNGEAVYNLTVNTSKDDYLATSYEDQTVDDPGNCHWVYVAYWEINGMSATNLQCNYSAWDNPGCDYERVFNFLDEILCVQKQNCDRANDRQQILGGNTGTVQTGPFTALEMINPYPDPSKVKTLSQFDNNRPGETNPATPNGNNWNWYYDCLPSEQTASDGSVVPGEQYKFKVITGSGTGGYVSRDFVYYTGFTTGPDGREDFTKGCVDNDGDFVQFYVDGIRPGRNPDGVLDGGTGFAVGDILEYYAVDQDPDTVPARFRVTAIDTSKAQSRVDCSQASWANEFSDSEMDPTQNCLPYCSTSGKQTFYWNDQGSPQPGVNCSDGIIGNDTATCNDDCPVCEQTVKVTVGDTTTCGALNFPQMVEGGGPGINNGRFLIGNTMIDNPNTLPPTIDKIKAEVYTRQIDGKKVVPVTVENWVSVMRATVGTSVTLGKDNAIDFDEVDNQALYDECCPSNSTTWECQDFWKSGKCQQFENGELSTNQEVDCDAEMRVVAQWYYKIKYKTSETGILPLPFWTNYDTPDETQIYNIATQYYPESAGNGTNGVALSYQGEQGLASYYKGSDITYIPADGDIEEISLYLSFKASNDQFGDPKFDNLPPGFNSGDFGTDNNVSSPRPPWNIGTQGPGPKDSIFTVGAFKLGETANLPSANDDWDMRIQGCSDAQVYPVLGPFDEIICGDVNSDNYYIGRSSGKFWEEEGKKDGVVFGRGYPQSGICSTGVTFDPKNGTGTKCSPGPFCPESYGFNDCLPRSDVKLNVAGIGGVDWGDYNVGGCTTGVKLLWYVNGFCRSSGFISGPTGDGGQYVCYNYANCGDVWEDFCRIMTDPEQTYTVTVYAVVNNIDDVAWKPVNRDWSTQTGDPYSFFDGNAWKCKRGSSRLPATIINAGGEDGEPIVIPENGAWFEGDVFQVILGSATCTVKGNNGSSSKDLTGLQAPEFRITASNQNFQNISYNSNFINLDICNPPCCNDGSPGNNCGEGIDALIDICGNALCGGTNSGSGTLSVELLNLNCNGSGACAWPTIPGTSNIVEGTVKYQWAKQNDSGQYVNITGATESSTSYVADGRRYRCTVTYDLAGKVPSGYTAKPESASASKVYVSDNVDLQTCPDGSVIPITEQCDDPQAPCIAPDYASDVAGSTLTTVNVFKPGESIPYSNMTIKNNTSATIVASPIIEGFENVSLSRAQCRLLVNGKNNAEIKDMNIIANAGDFITLRATFTDSGSNQTTTYGARYIIDYVCADGENKRTVFVDPNSASVTWNASGTGDDDGTGFPILLENPSCYYTNGYVNNSNCGSYLGRWQDFAGGTPTLYYQNARSTRIEDRGVAYDPNNVQQNANCQFCPPLECPILNITGVSQSPQQVPVNTKVTVQVNFSSNYNGFTPTNNVLGSRETIFWTGPGVPTAPALGGYPASIQLGPYTTPGRRTISVNVSQFYLDPADRCGPDNILNFKSFGDTYEFDIDVGGNDPEPPETEDPEFYNVSLTGDTTLKLVNGVATGSYAVSYQLTDGEGYIPNTRPVAAGWDGNTQKTEDQGGLTYDRTFTTPGEYNVTVELNKLFCPVSVGASRCTRENINSGNPPLSNKEKKWVVSDPKTIKVIVEGEDVGTQEPTIRTRVTANKTSGVAPVTITFTSTTQVDDGDWVRTPEPAALRYNVVNKNYTSTGTVNPNATLTQTWTETFTEAFSGSIGARYRRNYCPPGTPSDSNCVGKKGYLSNDHVNINITNPGPTGTKPKATINQNIAYTPQTVNGCGFNVNGPVSAIVTIDLTQGTGDYVWDDVETTTGNWVRNGQKLQQTVSRTRTGDYSFDLGTIVVFKKNGQEVHRDGSGTATVCINIIDTGIIPF